MPQIIEILSGFDKLNFPAVPKSMIGSVSELLREMGQKVFETKCFVYVLKDESKLVTRNSKGYVCTEFMTRLVILTLGSGR